MINNISETITLSINLNGNLKVLNKPLVMGVLNINNDSFYEKSRFNNIENMILTTQQMLMNGASIIDIGAASSRPGAKLIDTEQEQDALLPALEALVNHFPETAFSVDTYNARTAKAAVLTGATMINDISAGKINDEMFEVIASLNVAYIMMHMQGIPEFMQMNPIYDNVVQDTITFFTERIGKAREAGIKDIIIDPGFGFGKTVAHNYELLKALKLFGIFQMPILCGLSRKSFINKVINTKANEALNGTTVLNTIALLNGAHILRVHDVLEAKQVVELVNYYSTVTAQ